MSAQDTQQSASANPQDVSTIAPSANSTAATPNNHPRRHSYLSTADEATPPADAASYKLQKKNYSMKKKLFAKTTQSAIFESSQEVHSGWLKARLTFKRWTKVWCSVKPSYLIIYSSQEAQKHHRLGVILLSVCQVIKRPTKKEGFCFKLINPFGCSVWAKRSARVELAFSQTNLILRASDGPIGKVWLDAFNRCHLSARLEGYQPVRDHDDNPSTTTRQDNRPGSQMEISDSDDGDQSTRMFFSGGHSTSDSNSLASFNNNRPKSRLSNISAVNKPRVNGCPREEPNSSAATGQSPGQHRPDLPLSKPLTSQHVGVGAGLNPFNDIVTVPNGPTNRSEAKTNADKNDQRTTGVSSKTVAKFNKHSWQELQLDSAKYVGDDFEELGTAGMQSEEVHESNKNFLWHIIKQLRPGMDLSKVPLPTFILEPRSFLEKLADYYYHCDILTEAVQIEDPTQRLIGIVRWYLSGFYKKPKGPKKPYNPLLGEKFRCFWDHPQTQSRTFFVAEQVSHHPPMSAFHVSNRKDGYTITCTLLSRSKFGGNSVSAILDGKAKLFLSKRNETYTLTMPYANCRGILLGSLCLELGGKVEIECLDTRCKCELDFKIAPVWGNSNSYNALTGKILNNDKVTHTLEGHWDKRIDIVNKQRLERSTLWEVTETVRRSRLKRYTVAMEGQGERESVKLWSKVSEALKASDQAKATAEKIRLEEIQRQEARERRAPFNPELFRLAPDTNEWSYKWSDERPWDERRDIMQFEEDFKIRTLVLNTSASSLSRSVSPSAAQSMVPMFNPSIDLPLTQLVGKRPEHVIGSFQESLTLTPTTSSGNKPSAIDPDTVKSIESKIDAENQLIKQAIQKMSEKNRKLEEQLANLQRNRRGVAFVVAVLVVALLSSFLKYFP